MTLNLTMQQDGAPYWDFSHWQGNYANKSRQVQFVDRTVSVFGSTRTFRAEAVDGDDWQQSHPGSSVRSIVCAWTNNTDGEADNWYPSPKPIIPFPKEGETWQWSTAIEFPNDPKCPYPIGTLWELHQSGPMSTDAPVAVLSLYALYDGNIYGRLCGGNAEGNWDTFWSNPLTLIGKSVPGLHLFTTQVHYARDATGTYDVYHAIDQDKTFSHPISLKGATWPYEPDLPPEELYMCCGIYPADNPGRGPGGNYVYNYGTMVCDDLAAAFASFNLGGSTPVGRIPTNTAAPTISGQLLVGNQLVASTGTWTESPTNYLYQWQYSRDGGISWLDVNGATLQTFEESSTFSGTLIRVRVSAQNATGSGIVFSDPVGPIATPAATSLGVHVVSQTPTTVTIGWNLLPEQQGFLPMRDDSFTIDGKIRPNTSKTQNTLKFSKPTGGAQHKYGIALIGTQESVKT